MFFQKGPTFFPCIKNAWKPWNCRFPSSLTRRLRNGLHHIVVGNHGQQGLLESLQNTKFVTWPVSLNFSPQIWFWPTNWKGNSSLSFSLHIFSHINHVSSKKFFPFYVRTWAVMTGMVVHHNNDGLKICQSLQIIFFHCQTPLCHAKLILMDLAFYLIFDFKNMGKFGCLESTKSTKNNWLC